MKIISWNIRGMNINHKLDIVCNFVKEQKPNIFLIQETKMEKERAEKINSFKDYCLKASNSEGASGGTLILWKKSLFSIFILNETKHFMVVKMTNLN